MAEEAKPAATPPEQVETRPLAEVFAVARRLLEDFDGPELVGLKFCKRSQFSEEEWEETRTAVRNECKRLQREAERSGLGKKMPVARSKVSQAGN